jgi:hypothetical protein
MSKVAWSRAVVFLVAATGLADSACTVSVTGDDGGAGGQPAGDGDAAAQPEASGDDGGETPDSSTACAIGVSTGSAACDDCIDSNCCSAVVACDGETKTNADSTDCEEIDSCYGDCLSPPVDSGVTPGTASDCATLCSGTHTMQGQTDFNALQSCTQTSCASQCQ